MPPSRTALAALLAAALAGCAGTVERPAGPTGTSLADRFTALLDARCQIPAEPQADTAALREARLLRAEWLLAILTRYGAARIEDYSGDKAADAAMLLTRVEHSMAIIGRARQDVARDPNQFELYRADLIVALLHTARSAIEPVLQVQKGFVLKPDPEDGLRLLGNYFEDKLYAQAYEQTCKGYMAAAVQADKRPAVRQQVAEHLQENCTRLARQSGLASRCSTPAAN